MGLAFFLRIFENQLRKEFVCRINCFQTELVFSVISFILTVASVSKIVLEALIVLNVKII